MERKPLRNIVVVGGGTAGWMAAAVLSRALGQKVSITLVESEQIGTVGVGEATIPQIRLINRYLGIDEREFVAATQGSFKLGIRFEGWTRPGHAYIHAFGELGRGLDIAPFHHYWLRGRAEGSALDLWSYSLNAEAAAAGAFAPVEPSASETGSGINYAFHFDALLYAAVLRRYAESRGVVRIEGRVADIRLARDSGHIVGLQMADGRLLDGELFIDCSGFRGVLIEQALKTGYEDWSAWLPCDRAVTVPTSRTGPIPPFTRAIARPAGWQWRIPLQHRTGNGYVYCSRFLEDDQAAETLLKNVDGEALAEPRLLRFTTGRRRRFWNKNCVALGLAAGFMEPLESTSIHLIQSGISRLLALFPTTAHEPGLADEYNRQTGAEFERIRDFLILHYHANGRAGEPFWEERLANGSPDALGRRMRLFEGTGKIARESDELFTEQSWLQVLIGQGVQPRSWNPLADGMAPAQLAGFLSRLRRSVRRTARSLPDHADYLRRHCPAPEQA